MLGKLLKYEWRSSWRVIAAMNCFLILVTLLGIFSFRSTIIQSDNQALNILGVLTLIFYYLSIVVISVAVLIYMALRFYRNLYGDEGYLMHTLPVTASQHIISKILVAVGSYLVTLIVIILSVFSLAFSLFSAIDPTVDISGEISKGWEAVLPAIREAINMPLWLYFTLFAIGCVISLFSSVLMIYASISIGQMFVKHKVMGSILAYIGIYILEQTVMSYIALPQSISSMVNNTSEEMSLSAVLNSSFLSSFIISAIFGVGFYIVTLVLMKKKLNMD